MAGVVKKLEQYRRRDASKFFSLLLPSNYSGQSHRSEIDNFRTDKSKPHRDARANRALLGASRVPMEKLVNEVDE